MVFIVKNQIINIIILITIIVNLQKNLLTFITSFFSFSIYQYTNKINKGDGVFGYNNINKYKRINFYFKFNKITPEKIYFIANKSALNISILLKNLKKVKNNL